MNQFQVKQNKFSEHRVVQDNHEQALQDGEVMAKVESFAFTANNITYAVAGDMIGYWKFFPPIGNDADGWGVIPVWGFAEITESKADGVSKGDRLFGYWPPADTLKMKPVKVNPQSFIDGSEHRQELPVGYNVYRFADKAGQKDARADNERSLLFPLFLTGFLIWDAVKEASWYGAKQIIVLSASSKTSLGLAYALADDADAVPTIGLTSKGNVDFVNSLGVYSKVATYDDVTALDSSVPTTIVDMAGNNELLGKLHKHFGDNMKFTVNVGLTHWENAAPNPDVIAERSEFFFAPGQMQKRIKDWGAEGFDKKLNSFVLDTAEKCRSWLSVKEVSGLGGLESIYNAVCEGSANPNEGIIVRM
ncbi:MAG: DUF2855 family protein [Pseudomonadales bacterium]|nr:MAG: DUF2855 family protein [Pseudomonadales bacterium]